MSVLLVILATLALCLASLAIAYAVGTRVPPVAMAFGALAVLIAAGATLIAVVRHDITSPPASPAHRPATSDG